MFHVVCFMKMAIKQQIKDDVKDAMKQANQEVVGVLRMALSSVDAKEKEKRYALAKEKPGMAEEELLKQAVLQDEEMIDVIASEVKKRRDAIALYEKGGRPELADGEKKEIAILQKYLPSQLSGAELETLAAAAVEKTGAAGIKDMGRVMAALQPDTKGRADGNEVSKIVKKLLGA